jgi:hypothetical protein
MRHLILLTLLYLPLFLKGQITFNHRFHFDTPAAALTSIVVTDSCYYATGIYADTIPFLQVGNLFVKLDMEGNPVFVKKLISPEKSYETRTHTLTALEDGTFVVTGLSYDPVMKGMLIKYNDVGDTIWTKEYLNPIYPAQEFIHPLALARTIDGGFIISCWSEKSFGDAEIYLIKTDSLGNKQWGKFYGNSMWDRPQSLIVTSEGKIIAGGIRTNDNTVVENYSYRLHIFQVDNTGNVEWDYLSPFSEGLRDAANDMVLLDDGSLVVASGAGTELDRPSVNVVYFDKLFFKLNANHEIVWEREFKGSRLVSGTRLSNVVKLSDNSGFVGAGVHPIDDGNPNDEKWGWAGWVGKISNDGDSIWAREYSIMTTDAFEHKIYDLKETPDGGFILCGEARDWSGTDSIPQQAWLLKLDEYGCLVPGCYTASEEPAGGEPAISLAIYPNPATDYLNFYLRTPRPVRGASFRIVSAGGRLMKTFQSDRPDATFIVPVWDWPAGVYFLQYLEEGVVRASEKFVKQ